MIAQSEVSASAFISHELALTFFLGGQASPQCIFGRSGVRAPRVTLVTLSLDPEYDKARNLKTQPFGLGAKDGTHSSDFHLPSLSPLAPVRHVSRTPLGGHRAHH